MHDCRKTKEDLIDLVFNEVDAESELQLLEELEACRGCRAEYHSMREALGNFDDAMPAMLPTAEFWPEHHARLEERIEQAAVATRNEAPLSRTDVPSYGASVRPLYSAGTRPLWRRAFQKSFSVPVPVAIAAAILLAATSVFAIRSFISQPSLRTAPGEAAGAKVQYVEVPVEKRVVEEKIVTRTVYVTKRAGRVNQPAPSLQDLQGMTAQKSKDETVNTQRATLNGFQPPSDVKLTVIKGSFNDEK